MAGNVYAVVDKGGQREVKTIATGLNLPNGVAFKDGTLYIAEISRITKMAGIEDRLDNPPEMKVVYDVLPRDQAHGWKSWRSGLTGSSTSRSGRRAISACRRTPTPISRA